VRQGMARGGEGRGSGLDDLGPTWRGRSLYGDPHTSLDRLRLDTFHVPAQSRARHGCCLFREEGEKSWQAAFQLVVFVRVHRSVDSCTRPQNLPVPNQISRPLKFESGESNEDVHGIS
jgi:hypothetical protein